jgi:hypothetical protein
VEETREHLFFDCPAAVFQWFSLGILWDDSPNIHHQIYIAKQRFVYRFFMEVFMIGAWCLWKERNNLIFNNTS